MTFLKLSVKSFSGSATLKKSTKHEKKQHKQSQSLPCSLKSEPTLSELFMYKPAVNTFCMDVVSSKIGPNTLYQGIYSEKSNFLVNFHHTGIPTLPQTSPSLEVVSVTKPNGNQWPKESYNFFPTAETYSTMRDDSNSDSCKMRIPHQSKNFLQKPEGSNTTDSPTFSLSRPQVKQLQKTTHDDDNTTMTTMSDNSSSDLINSSVRNHSMSATMSKKPVVVVIGEAKSDEDDTPQYTSVSGTSRSISSRRFNQGIKNVPKAILVHKNHFNSKNYPTPVQTPNTEHYKPSPSSEHFVFNSSSSRQNQIFTQQKFATSPVLSTTDRNSIISAVSTVISSSDESFSKSPEWSDSPLSTEFSPSKDFYHFFSKPCVQFSETVEKTPDAIVTKATAVQTTDLKNQTSLNLVENKMPAGLALKEPQLDQENSQQEFNRQPQPELYPDSNLVIAKLKDKNPFLPIIMNLCGMELESNNLCDNNSYSHHYDDELELFDYYLTIP